MSEEARNVELLRKAYGKWSETLGGSADHWLEICAEKIAFGSLANGPPGSTYLTAYQARDDLKSYFAWNAPQKVQSYGQPRTSATGHYSAPAVPCAPRYRLCCLSSSREKS